MSEIRPRDLPGLSELMQFIPASGSLMPSDTQDPATVPIEDSAGLKGLRSASDTFRGYQSFLTSRAGGGIFESLQVAFGGVVDGENPQPDELPNTFLDPASNVFSTVEFSVVNHESIILLVRVRGNDGRFYPRIGDDPDAVSLSLKAEYDNGAETFFSLPVQSGTATANADFVQSEEVDLTEGGTEESEFKPLIFIVPLRSIITFVTIQSASFGLSLSLRVRRSPGELDEFGFLAVNRSSNVFSMNESRVGKNFGLVFDQVGAWDIIISPEATCRQVQSSANSNFTYSGRTYSRTPIDVDENFVVGVGNPVVNSDNDITSFDTSFLPSAVRNGISIVPVSGYPRVWVLRIQPAVREYLIAQRRSAPPNSLQGCYIDLPIYARGSRSLAEGRGSIRIFAEVNCVFDYTFCDFYWNLGTPLANVPAVVIQNQLEISFEELIDCQTDASLDSSGNIVATSFFLVSVRNIPALDTGTGMLLIKTPAPPPFLTRIYKPSADVSARLKRLPTSQSAPPWVFSCPALTPLEINTINKLKLYVGGLTSNPITDPIEIASRSTSESSILVIQPRFNFPPGDEISPDSPTEKVIASMGFTFRNWRNSNNRLFVETLLLAAEFKYPTTASVDLKVPLVAKFYYNEDRRVM